MDSPLPPFISISNTYIRSRSLWVDTPYNSVWTHHYLLHIPIKCNWDIITLNGHLISLMTTYKCFISNHVKHLESTPRLDMHTESDRIGQYALGRHVLPSNCTRGRHAIFYKPNNQSHCYDCFSTPIWLQQTCMAS